MARRRARAFFVVFALGPALGLACNVFASLDRCDSDADCASGATCDPTGKFCVGTEATPDAPPDLGTDARDAGADADADADAGPPPCDPATPFVALRLVSGFEGTIISSARFTPTEAIALYSASNGCTDEACADLFVASRSDRDAAFGAGTLLPVVNCPNVSEYWPTITSDGKVLFFESSRQLDGGCTSEQPRVWSATRVNAVADFDPPKIQSLFAIPSGGEGAPYLHPAGRSLYFVSSVRDGGGGQDIFVANLDALGFATTIDNVAAVSSPVDENMPVVSLDDTALYFARVDPIGTNRDIWVAKRSSPSGTFGTPSIVTEVSSDATDEWPSWISDDNCRLYYVSNQDAGVDASGIGAYRLWVAERPRPP